MTYFNWLEWAVIILGISVFILGSLLMQVLNETQRQRQSVDTHSHQLKRLATGLEDLEVKNKELREQVSDDFLMRLMTLLMMTAKIPASVDDLLDETAKSSLLKFRFKR